MVNPIQNTPNTGVSQILPPVIPPTPMQPLKRPESSNFAVSRVFHTTLWLTIQPLVVFIKGILFLFSEKNPDMTELRQELEKIVLSETVHTTEDLEALIAAYRKDPRYSSKDLKIIFDMLSIPELRPHIREILAGANVCFDSSKPIENDVDLVTRWPMFKGMHKRKSSHNPKDGLSFGIDCGNIVDHIHVWVDQKGCLRFQCEKAGLHFSFSISSLLKGIVHLSDYLAYKSTGKQQGPLGKSHHIDTNPITCTYDTISFEHVSRERSRLFQLFEKAVVTKEKVE